MFVLNMLIDSDQTGKFNKLFQKYQQPLFRYAFSIVKNKQVAEEVVQDAFIRVFRNLHKIVEVDCSKTWHFLVIIVRRVSITTLNKEQQNHHENIDDVDVADDTDGQMNDFTARELYEELQERLQELHELDRLILILRVTYDLSYKDIAEAVGLSEKNISVRLVRIRKLLRKQSGYFGGERDAREHQRETL